VTAEAIDPQTVLDMMPFARTLGMEFDTLTPAEVVGRLPWSAKLCTTAGVLHGGALVSLADSVGGVCAYLNLPPGATTSTIELKANFFMSIRQGVVVVAIAHPLHSGRTVIVVQTDLYGVDQNDSRRRVAQVTQTQAVLR
jgi:1,4-dihydroxy-2-naphthoyl-CoA hydrolase